MPADDASRISRDAPAPLHVRIAAAFRDDVLSGQWPEHYQLPPEPALAEPPGVSRGTLRKALAILSEEGLLTQTRGRRSRSCRIRCPRTSARRAPLRKTISETVAERPRSHSSVSQGVGLPRLKVCSH
ncbi:GntR family transcriptional regulator [Saccharopolyspora sp. ASAGF58]|uniref:GntR family transcriptional regulator n=1 Tax=Saccharopolyspora sp. ASAGF58 TaxID=2719023 RepID=UPI001B301506